MTEETTSRAQRLRSDGERSRRRILAAAARLVTIEGLDGLSIARLADASGMSKSGLYAHFESKEALQLAAIETAYEIFRSEVVEPASGSAEGVERLASLCEAFLSHLERGVFPGGCFLAAAASEVGPRPGPLKARLEELHAGWLALLSSAAAAGVERGQIRAEEELEQLVFELDAYLALANTMFILHGDRASLDRARRAVADRLERAGPPPRR
jgi:AcrR family transcriptional regulator